MRNGFQQTETSSRISAGWRSRKSLTWFALLSFAVTSFATLPVSKAFAQKGATLQPSQVWTLDEALAQLQLYPRDAYLQYVALQLARREGRMQQVVPQVSQRIGDRGGRGFNGRAGQVDLFSIFSGALAVQESLQLDTMRGERPGARAGEQGFELRERNVRENVNQNELRRKQAAEAKRRAEAVPLAELSGPTIKSHPWKEMLGDKKPQISILAKSVPDDFFFIEFHSLNKLLDVMDTSDIWSTHLFSQAEQEAQTQLVGQRLQQQLAVESNELLRPFYDSVVDEIAVTGSDLFYREGSDITLLFRVLQPEIFKARMDGFLVHAEQANPKISRTTGSYLGVNYVHVASPDRSVHVFSAYPTAGLHVRSNSLVALQRVLEAIKGKTAEGRNVQRLGDTDEFAYIRTLMPQGAKEEDGLVYLSDPFIRRNVGPRLKLTERRRMLCYNHLRMINHAAMLYRTEHGKPAASLNELAQAGCTPGEFGEGLLTCPDGGTYGLSEDGLTGVCSHHGHAHTLKPCCELELSKVTREEADEYNAFLDEYNQYWRTFFDPIALRIQITPQRYRLETIVLPLIDNSIYTGLAGVLGGPPEALDALAVPKRNIFSMAVRLNKSELLRQSGLEQYLKDNQKQTEPDVTAQLNQAANSLKQLGLALHNYHDTYLKFPTAVSYDKAGKKTGLSWRVHLLPYLDEGELYREFHLDEPWDSEHNKKLVVRVPEIFRPQNAKLAKAGKTKFLAPLGENTMFPTKKQEIQIRDITDGLSNTIMLVEAHDDQAVIWTKPDDLEIDFEQPLKGLAIRPPAAFLVLVADGSVHFHRESINATALAAMFTRSGGEVVNLRDSDQIALRLSNRRRRGLFDIPMEIVDPEKLAGFLTKGIGNQVGMHVYDADPMFDFSLPSFLGQAFGTFNGGRGGFRRMDEGLMIGMLVASLNSPVYVSIPVQDGKVVDEFLEELDKFLSRIARTPQRGGFFQVEQDFYRLPLGEGQSSRSFGFRFGPVKWRFFWARIGNGLYVASQPFILKDLMAFQTNKVSSTSGSPGQVAHAMIRIRPTNWDRVLENFRLGWEENNRQACLNNLGPLSSLSRSLTTQERSRSDSILQNELQRLTAQIYDTHFYCPDDGHYHLSPDGKIVTCSVHDSATSPRQLEAPSPKSDLGKLLKTFSDMTLLLTFQDDGLHAVVNIERN